MQRKLLGMAVASALIGPAPVSARPEEPIQLMSQRSNPVRGERVDPRIVRELTGNRRQRRGNALARRWRLTR